MPCTVLQAEMQQTQDVQNSLMKYIIQQERETIKSNYLTTIVVSHWLTVIKGQIIRDPNLGYAGDVVRKAYASQNVISKPLPHQIIFKILFYEFDTYLLCDFGYVTYILYT